MKVINLVEHEDGSATVTLHMNNEEHRMVMEGALVRGLALSAMSKPTGWNGFTTEEWLTIVNNAIDAKQKGSL
jgi:hypothetical protein